MLPKITDRSETYSSHLERLIKEQSLRATPQGNEEESAPLGSPGETLAGSACISPLRNTPTSKLKLLPSDHGMETGETALNQPSKAQRTACPQQYKAYLPCSLWLWGRFPSLRWALYSCQAGAALMHTPFSGAGAIAASGERQAR